ncbi:hypothetical protein P152DRAFT_453660 [Eremomyces bilateralis CBS 781.70]|uniref:mRNA decay factor PAT1 domain-containing protein n=1 Tax=Eremomyces bilateralis CBS 781.70 TaxID=1392243 RepID=A0A6G1GG75_9PEZI|nr:uncharacterized protein P152DRAFT_453660 [Eremomyces bilateralis CBS 781.70]KAF1817053.1 hypothetical protein P152DRAFT_453660 [Eremomyces bilateralis CBS 781.70]
MSFFGFDTTLPRDRKVVPGFSSQHDAFAGLEGGAADDNALEFEDTYDGLGDQLSDADDALNDDTFGEQPATQAGVGRDFDFASRTARVADAMQEEQMIYHARHGINKPQAPPPVQYQPAKTGYENYADASYIPRLEADAALWGIPPKAAEAPREQPGPAAARKMMSLEEVEAMMRQQSVHTTQQPAPQSIAPEPVPHHQQQFQPPGPPPPQFSGPPQVLQRPHPQQPGFLPPIQQAIPHDARSFHERPPMQAELPGQGVQHPQILQRPKQAPEPSNQRQQPRQRPPPQQARASPQPRQILQNPNRLSGQGQPVQQPRPSDAAGQRVPTGPAHQRGPSYSGPIITNPQQILQLSDEERKAYLIEEAKRAKRNHKIHMLSKDNGLMTPQDKNFITRIQLQQLMASIGNLDEAGSPEAIISDDFYYQVYAQIRGAARAHPGQPASQFAQTYLFQTGGRYGFGRRGRQGNADNHIQRMEQQVARAVEAAKAKPKNKQLVIEGSLGKISFSNAKTPKPLLNIKPAALHHAEARPGSAQGGKDPHGSVKDEATERRKVLKDLETVYETLMAMEDHDRRMPPPLTEESSADLIQAMMEWRHRLGQLNKKLWNGLRVMEPIVPGSPIPHPFILLVNHGKGMKALGRVFRHIDDNQRLTITTLTLINLDHLRVIQHGVPPPNSTTLPQPIKDEIDLFTATINPLLFAVFHDSPLNVVVGLLGLIVERTTIPWLARTKIGTSILTLLVSRAEVLREALVAQQAAQMLPAESLEQQLPDLAAYRDTYTKLFAALEPALPFLFGGFGHPAKTETGDDVHVWQFLACIGAAADPGQQQRLVLGVKDRVMETVGVARSLPGEEGEKRLHKVNLFMRGLGLDVELLS